jgi:hypothetical protein
MSSSAKEKRKKHEMLHFWQVGDNRSATLHGKGAFENSQTPA